MQQKIVNLVNWWISIFILPLNAYLVLSFIDNMTYVLLMIDTVEYKWKCIQI